MPTIEQDNWRVTYDWSASSGVRLGATDYQGTRVLHDASVPFVYVNYQGAGIGPFTDELRSTTTDVVVREIVGGFDIVAKYDLYGPDYEYDHIWRFHHDGQLGSTVIIHGPGEELHGRHTYHVPFRFDLDLSGASGDSFQERSAFGLWQDVALEGRHFAVFPWTADFAWRVIDRASGKSARIRGRLGDGAELWALRYKDLERWGSWGGAQASPPGWPGSVPAIYDDGQSVQHADLVVWYIAHVSALDRVSACGPWLALDGFPAPDEKDGDHHDDHGHATPHEASVNVTATAGTSRRGGQGKKRRRDGH